MEGSSCVRATIIVTFLLLVAEIMSARHISRQHSHDGHHHPTMHSKRSGMGMMMKADGIIDRSEMRKAWMKHKKTDTLQIAGSALPDCSHACGSCSPCRLVMVSFVCSTIQEAETCPMSYKCMCNNKSYPVP